MNSRVAVALGIILAVVWLIRLFPNSAAGRIAFSWFGPTPRVSESWARYQFRWAVYSLDWLGQIAVMIAILLGILWVAPDLEHHSLFLVFIFALPIAAGMAVLALCGFLVRAAKAAYLGPNPIWDGPEVESIGV